MGRTYTENNSIRTTFANEDIAKIATAFGFPIDTFKAFIELAADNYGFADAEQRGYKIHGETAKNLKSFAKAIYKAETLWRKLPLAVREDFIEFISITGRPEVNKYSANSLKYWNDSLTNFMGAFKNDRGGQRQLEPLETLVKQLQDYWAHNHGKVNMVFLDNFDDPDHPDKNTYTPANHATEFLMSCMHLIDSTVTAGSCQMALYNLKQQSKNS